MIEQLISIDHLLFEWINQEATNPFLDMLMPYWRAKTFWIPFYILLLIWIGVQFRVQVIYFIFGVALTIGIADTMSSKVIKPNMERLRPCNNQLLKKEVHLLVRCGSGYSFTSSHATNHFALALFLIFTLGSIYPLIKWPLLFWAGSIAYGQVYVGVHFPFDVICGALLGSLIGWGVAKLYEAIPGAKLTFSVSSQT